MIILDSEDDNQVKGTNFSGVGSGVTIGPPDL